MGALDGIRVLDLTWGIAGPAGILMLAEHGADVVKVEPPGGDPYRDYPGYRVWNRSRRSVTLDLHAAADKDRFLELVGTADVLAESFSPGTMAKLGLDYESIADRFPQLLYLSVPAYPAASRHASRPGWDALVQARSGMQNEQPGWRPGPIFLASAVPSMATSFLVPIGVLSALHARERTGRGQRVETTLYQGVLAVTSMLWAHAERNQNQLQAIMTKTYPPGIHQAEVLECADGWVQSLPATEKPGVTINEVVGLPADVPPQELYKNLAELYPSWKRDDLVERLLEESFQIAAIQPTRDALRHPQVIANGMTVEVDDPEVGRTVQVGIPFKLSRCESTPVRPRPAPGQHTAEVLAERRGPRPTSADAGTIEHPTPLAGIRVLDMGRAFAGPFAAMVLAALGADVIKVASSKPDMMTAMLGASTVWLGCEQGKRSFLVDMKAPGGLEIVHRLVERSDVVTHNMTKGAPERLGIDYESLRKVKPDLIYCNSFMYGPVGPLSHLGGQDSLAQALGGLEWEAGPAEEGNPPLYYRFGHCDTTNALASVAGILMALAHRDRTGEGQAVWASLLNGAVYLGSEVYLTEDGASNPPKLDKGQTGFGPLYRLYETQDGWIQVAAVKPSDWSPFCRVVGRPDLEHDDRFATPAARTASRSALEAELEPALRTKTAVQWRRLFDDADVPAEIATNTLDGELVMFDEENRALGLVAETQHAELGRLRQVGNLVTFSDTPGHVHRAPPVPGAHTDEIMQWLGYDAGEIDDYKTQGVISSG
jgi:crotonobetainyl-CoA:carnitine CoA-transferase CaiB-like acyl-CoA transferase